MSEKELLPLAAKEKNKNMKEPTRIYDSSLSLGENFKLDIRTQEEIERPKKPWMMNVIEQDGTQKVIFTDYGEAMMKRLDELKTF